MKKSASILLCCLLLTGCSSGYNTGIQDGDTKVMTVGKNSYTKSDLYDMLKKSVGAQTAINLLQNLVYSTEIPVTDEIRQQAEEEFNTMASETENIDQLLQENGYTKESYIEQIVIPNIQSDKLFDKYFKDNQTKIKKAYKPSKAIILQCDDQKKAEEALAALKEGKDRTEVFNQYKSENASYSDDEVLVSTQSTNVPTRMINTLYKQKNAGLVDEVFTSESATAAYVTILVDNNYDNLKDQLKEALSTNTEFATECVQFYLQKHDFQIHDQDIFNEFRTSHPQFLTQYPELMNAQ